MRLVEAIGKRRPLHRSSSTRSVILCCICLSGITIAYSPHVSRRRAVIDFATGHALASACSFFPQPNFAADFDADARLSLDIETNRDGSYSISIPRIGYSLYKTPIDQVPKCMELALQAGVKHFDVASLYGTNNEVGLALKSYLLNGVELEPNPSSSRAERRRRLFVNHKVSNEEQSESRAKVKRAVKDELKKLKVDYLDMCSVHSPLTDEKRRLMTYEALLELQNEGVVRCVGVCNYGTNPLREIVDAGFPVPCVDQLVLSPFNQHEDVLEWAKNHRMILSCNAWSKLSSTQGPQDGWAKVAEIGKDKGMTKAQVLVRWAFQRGFLSVPRSGSKSKIERFAIQENSYLGVKDFVLSDREMGILNDLDEQLPAGRLGILDGWSEAEIKDDTWDPTLAV